MNWFSKNILPIANESIVTASPDYQAEKPAKWETWGIGFIIVTISAFASPLGILIIPLLGKTLYERLMTFLVALGIGALSGSIMYIMLPQAFKVTEQGAENYLVKSSIVLGALYGFFLIDRLLQYLLEVKRQRRARRIHSKTLQIVSGGASERSDSIYSNMKSIVCNADDLTTAEEMNNLASDLKIAEITNAVFRRVSTRRCVPVIQTIRSRAATMRCRAATMQNNVETLRCRAATAFAGTKVGFDEPTVEIPPEDDTVSVAVEVVEKAVVNREELHIASVAYMIIFGASANNFIDGMSNGVAFSDSLVRGLSVGIACIAQQLPQELGTLAILIQSGLGMKRALLLNLIPGFLSYLGFILGAVLDNNMEGADDYVFSISSGMYLYVFLGTLIPELREATNELIKKDMKESIYASLLQAVGMIVGVVFMFCMAKYGYRIRI